jgi:glycosyltransferase involved in cell wall biosynthesis
MPDTSIVPFPTQKDVYQLAMVGNLLCMHKGQDTMFQVLAQEQWINKPWHLNIYGQGMDRQYLEDLAQMYGIASKITFHGRVEDIRQLWAHNHLLLMPSVMEGMPLAVVEAMLCGRPVLATDVGGHAEWIDDNTNGFIAAASTFGSLQHALLSAWERKEDWEEMGKLAHAKVTKLYDPYAGKTFLNLIEKIVANGQ